MTDEKNVFHSRVLDELLNNLVEVLLTGMQGGFEGMALGHCTFNPNFKTSIPIVDRSRPSRQGSV